MDLEVDGSIITNNAEKADIFARNFKDIVNGPLHTINENQEVVINTAKKENMNSNYNDRFTLYDFNSEPTFIINKSFRYIGANSTQE